MTNENKEAIEIIKNYKVFDCGYCHQGGDEVEEAFKTAIKALEQIEIWNATTKDRQIIAPKGTFRKIWEDEQQPSEDCISRQAVLDEAFEVDTKEYGRTDVVGVDAIDALPSVKPSYNSIKIELEPCEDCVSREDVVRILDWSKASVQMLDDYSADELVGEIIAIEKEVENLLSVKPQTVTDFADKCKECGKILNETYQQKWIPCSERLPEDEQEILFSTKTGRVHSGKYHDDDSANPWYSYRDKCRAWNNVVTAWMPLPEPYKVESEVQL